MQDTGHTMVLDLSTSYVLRLVLLLIFYARVAKYLVDMPIQLVFLTARYRNL